MPYRDNRVWDSKRGWVNPHRGIVIYRNKPVSNVSLEEIKKMNEAPISKKWETKGKGFWREGYKKGTNPYDRYMKYLTKKRRFERLNKWLNRIPFVKIIVVEENDTRKNPFTRSD